MARKEFINILSNQGKSVRDFVFFAFFYLYVLFAVETELIYHGAGRLRNLPVFFKGISFFENFLTYPGGLVEYISAFLFQFFYHNWSGAFVVTLQGWLICWGIDYFIKKTAGHRLRCFRFVPGIILLVFYTQYLNVFVITTAFLVSMMFVCLYLKATENDKLSATVLFLIMSLVLYALNGGGYILFALLCAIYELFFRKRFETGLVCLLAGLIVPYLEGMLIFKVSPHQAFSNLLPFSHKAEAIRNKTTLIIMYAFYLLLPATVILSGIGNLKPSLFRVGNFKTSYYKRRKKRKDKRDQESLPKHGLFNKTRWFIELLVLFSVTLGAILYFYNGEQKAIFKVDYYAYHKMWPKVLEAAKKGSDIGHINHCVNRALYHSGQLGNKMFSYPQHSHFFLLSGKKFYEAHWIKIDTYLDLGFINWAEHELVISLENLGPLPTILKRLAIINMIKGNIVAAKIYLNKLSRTPFYSDWANKYLTIIKTDPDLLTDTQIQNMRGLNMKTDYCFADFEVHRILSDLLKSNNKNQMAFEYLMSMYLLNKNLEGFMQNLHRFGEFNYLNIPRHYEEAILIYSYSTKKEMELAGYQISQKSHQVFNDIGRLISFYGNPGAASSMLEEMYGDTYFFYYLYRKPGVIND
jgi:hypothetical protein